MKKYFLRNQKGVTLLEGLIALLLLALIATGTFGVLLSTSRRSTQPDIREEMTLAVERAMNKLQVYVYPNSFSLPTGVQNGLCGGDASPILTGWHNIECMLPPICSISKSHFRYEVQQKTTNKDKLRLTDVGCATANFAELTGLTAKSPYSITFDIECNGFKL